MKLMEGRGQLCYIVFILVTVSSCICIACNYTIKDFPPDRLMVTNNLDIGQSIFTFMLLDLNGSRVTDKQIELDPAKPLGREFYKISVGSNGTAGELVVQKCPLVDALEQLYFAIPDVDLCETSFGVYVTAESVFPGNVNISNVIHSTGTLLQSIWKWLPVYQIQSEVYITVGSTEHTVDVLQIKLNDTRHCVNFVCFAGAFNSNKTFTVENGTNWVQTTTEDINFGFIYVLGIECEQPLIPSLQTNYQYALVNVTFITGTTTNNLSTSPAPSLDRSSAIREIKANNSATYWTTQSYITTPVDSVTLTLASLSPMFSAQHYYTTLLKATTVSSRVTLKGSLPIEKAFFNRPVNILAVGLTVGAACLSGAGILIYYCTSRKCRTMTPVSPAVLDNDHDDQPKNSTASRFLSSTRATNDTFVA